MRGILGIPITDGTRTTTSGPKIRIRQLVNVSGTGAAARAAPLSFLHLECKSAACTRLGRKIRHMNHKRVSLGFDLRVNPALQGENSSQVNQRLVPELRSPVSADPSVWLTTEEIRSLSLGVLPDFSNPLHLSKSIELLRDACQSRGVLTTGLCPICVTSYETDLIALIKRYGPGYFETRAEEGQLLSQGWQLRGFDVVDLDGLISGLKGCGYVEPAWSQLRNYFGVSLNEIGLFSDLSVASQFAEVRGLQIRDHAPFVVVGVLTHDPIA
jgi:hypothetical protein